MHLAQRKRRITGTGGKDKSIAFGMLERGGQVRASVVPNRRLETVQPEIKSTYRRVRLSTPTNGLPIADCKRLRPQGY
jgi:hypothetical protein